MQRPQLYILILVAAVIIAAGCETTPASQREVTVVYPEEVKYAEIEENTPAPEAEKTDLIPEIEETSPVEKGTDKIQVPTEEKKETPVKKADKTPKENKKEAVKNNEKSTPTPEKKQEPSVQKKEIAVVPPAVKPEKKQKLFHLRVISLPFHSYYQKEACAIADFIKKKENLKYAIARKSRNRSTEFWVVDVGGFNSLKASEAKDFQKRIQRTKYQGVHQFEDAFYVRY